jgi:hypothetical protein
MVSTFAGRIVDFVSSRKPQSDSLKDVAVATAQARNVPRLVSGQDGSDWQNRSPFYISLSNLLDNHESENCHE